MSKNLYWAYLVDPDDVELAPDPGIPSDGVFACPACQSPQVCGGARYVDCDSCEAKFEVVLIREVG